MRVRPATIKDAEGMSTVLADIVSATKRVRPTAPEHVRTHYIENLDSILCSVAEDEDGEIIGFQSLIQAKPDNRYGVKAGWGIIGTHVSPRAARRGVGSALFTASREAARQAGLDNIDATIGENNPEGLAYYEALGFRTYRTKPGMVCKQYKLHR